MPLLPTQGPNSEFEPLFTLPGGFFLWGYTRTIDKPAGTARYNTVRVKVHPPILASKYAAVKTALEGALPGTKARLNFQGLGGAGGYARIDLVFGAQVPPNLNASAPATAANVTTVLAAGATAIAA